MTDDLLYQLDGKIQSVKNDFYLLKKSRDCIDEQKKRIEQLEAALRFYAEPWKHVDQIPDFYSELGFAETARDALEMKYD